MIAGDVFGRLTATQTDLQRSDLDIAEGLLDQKVLRGELEEGSIIVRPASNSILLIASKLPDADEHSGATHVFLVGPGKVFCRNRAGRWRIETDRLAALA